MPGLSILANVRLLLLMPFFSCAAGLVVLKYLETALQVADMFTKQIFPKHFERLRRVMMGHENFDDMQARYVQVKASGDDMDDPKLYVDSKPGRPPK